MRGNNRAFERCPHSYALLLHTYCLPVHRCASQAADLQQWLVICKKIIDEVVSHIARRRIYDAYHQSKKFLL